MNGLDAFVIGWMIVADAAAFMAFAYDKWCAKRSLSRVPEFWLVLLGAAGGWPGGFNRVEADWGSLAAQSAKTG